MTYTANDYLNDSISRLKRSQLWAFLFLIVFFAFILFASYSRFPSLFWVTLIFYVAIFLLGVNSVTIVDGRRMNKIIKSITINEHITIETYSYRLLFYKLEAKSVEVNKNDISINEIDFPYKRWKLNTDKALVIKYKDQEFYLPYECFPAEIKAQLM